MIIVTGSGRSGTSAVARILHDSGISVGHDLIEADTGNAEGYFEERRLIELDDAILNAAGMSEWFTIAPREVLLTAAAPRHDEMLALLRGATPAWKDPRFCWTLEAWMELMYEAPRVIVCLRSPTEVVASTLKYYGQTSEEAVRHVELRWIAEYERLLEVIEAYGLDAITIEFDALHNDPQRATAPLGRFLAQEPSAIGRRALDVSGVRQNLRHHIAEIPAAMRELYDRVLCLRDPGPR
jgi:hypothetical protein